MLGGGGLMGGNKTGRCGQAPSEQAGRDARGSSAAWQGCLQRSCTWVMVWDAAAPLAAATTAEGVETDGGGRRPAAKLCRREGAALAITRALVLHRSEDARLVVQAGAREAQATATPRISRCPGGNAPRIASSFRIPDQWAECLMSFDGNSAHQTLLNRLANHAAAWWGILSSAALRCHNLKLSERLRRQTGSVNW